MWRAAAAGAEVATVIRWPSEHPATSATSNTEKTDGRMSESLALEPWPGERPQGDRHAPASLRSTSGRAVFALCFFFHSLESRVVVRELVQMGERDLAGDEGIIVRHVRQQVVKAVFELDIHPSPELVDVEGRGRPVDSDLLADLPRFFRG